MADKISSLLFDSILDENYDTVVSLLKYGADPNLILPNGAAPIHVAVGIDDSTLSESITKLLLKYGADPNVRSSDGSTPMHIAATYSRSENLKHLLDYGGDPGTTDVDGLSVAGTTSCELCQAIISYYFECDSKRDSTGGSSTYSSWESYHTCNSDDDRQDKSELTVVHNPSETLNIPESDQPKPIAWTVTLDDIRKAQQQQKSDRKASTRFPAWTIAMSNDSSAIKSRQQQRVTPVRTKTGTIVDRKDRKQPPVSNATFVCSKSSIQDKTFVVRPHVDDMDGDAASRQIPSPDNDDTFTSDNSAKTSEFDFDSADLPSFSVAENRDSARASPVMSLISRFKKLRASYKDLKSGGGNNLTHGNSTCVKSNQERPIDECSIVSEDDSACKGETIIWNSPRYHPCAFDDSVTSTTFRPAIASTSIDSQESSLRLPELDTPRSYGSAGNTDTSQSSGQSVRTQCSCQAPSEQMIITDEEEGYSLVEVHLGSEPCVCSSVCTSPECNYPYPHACSPSCSYQSDSTLLYDWKDGLTDRETDSEAEKAAPVPRQVACLSDTQLRSCLLDLGDHPGPVIPSTRRQYELRLVRVRQDPSFLNRNGSQKSDFLPELANALEGNLNLSSVQPLEDEMHMVFASPDPMLNWREGTKKASFNYLLLDPRVTQNLPMRAKKMSHDEGFRIFVKSVFYIGKGKRTRPYAHFKEAIRNINNPEKEPSPKVQQIMDVWKAGLGVISLHIFQNTIPVEAYTREACMIEAFGLARLTNKCKGQTYGPAAVWSRKEIRTVGVSLLKKAYHILLFEGERQIKPHDVKTK